jgi:hypothetical protein
MAATAIPDMVSVVKPVTAEDGDGDGVGVGVGYAKELGG